MRLILAIGRTVLKKMFSINASDNAAATAILSPLLFFYEQVLFIASLLIAYCFTQYILFA